MHRRPSPIRTAVAVALLLTVGLAAGCGSGSSSSSDSAPTTTKGPCADTKVSGPFGKAPEVTVAVGGQTPSALVKKDVITGSGKEAKTGGGVTMNYALYLCSDGSKVESTFGEGQPFSATLEQGSLIEGWVQGVPGMKVGGRRMLVIPPDLAYGDQSQAGIPANSTLLFVIDLVSVP